MINVIPAKLVTDSALGTCMAVYTDDWSWTNSKGMTWHHKDKGESDGHSTGTYFRHFDFLSIAAFNHDKDCIAANLARSYAMRRAGDRAYKQNLRDLGASWATIHRRYAAVSAYSRWLKLKGDLK